MCFLPKDAMLLSSFWDCSPETQPFIPQVETALSAEMPQGKQKTCLSQMQILMESRLLILTPLPSEQGQAEALRGRDGAPLGGLS